MAVVDRPRITAVVALTVAALLASCGSSSSPPAPTTSAPSSSAPTTSTTQPVEVNPPGDIPDNQAFVAYAGIGFRVSVPEGWARTTRPGGAVFSDKYASVTVDERALAAAPTASSVRATELPTITAAASGFTLTTITSVRRSAGPAVLVTYRALSALNPVTGKVARLEVERYAFWRSGREVVLTLAAPVGSDNVDPWRKVTDSLAWT